MAAGSGSELRRSIVTPDTDHRTEWHPKKPGQKHPKVWRATAWEVHPASSYEVLSGPPQ